MAGVPGGILIRCGSYDISVDFRFRGPGWILLGPIPKNGVVTKMFAPKFYALRASPPAINPEAAGGSWGKSGEVRPSLVVDGDPADSALVQANVDAVL